MRIDQILSKRYNNYTRRIWQKRIQRGEVLFNRRLLRPSRRMNKNDKVVFVYPTFAEPKVNANYQILYQDDFLLCLYKPAHLPVHASSSYQNNNLIDIVQNREKQNFFLLHRLDRETDGVLLLAKDKKTAQNISKQFANGIVQKKYLALVHGNFSSSVDASGMIGPAPILQNFRMQVFFLQEHFDKLFKDKKQIKNINIKKYKKARTEFFPLKPFKNFTLLQVILHSGRTHQIRATSFALGFPLVGDKLYNNNPTLMTKFVKDTLSPLDKKQLVMERSALHCQSLTFFHPQTKKQMRIESPPPMDFLFL